MASVLTSRALKRLFVISRILYPKTRIGPSFSNCCAFSSTATIDLHPVSEDLSHPLSQFADPSFCSFYSSLDLASKRRFLSVVARDVDATRIGSTVTALHNANNDNTRGPEYVLRLLRDLREQLVPSYEKRLRQIAGQENGLRFLMDMRSDVLNMLEMEKDPYLQAFDGNLRDLLGQWFSVEFLELKRITWESPACVLEKIMSHEAVHPLLGNWDELQRRVGPGRRVYTFLHPSVRAQPLVFVNVALMPDASADMETIFTHPSSPELEQKATTAVFYSITSHEKSLSGIDLGNFLIKRVAKQIALEFPQIKTYVTLSPIPGFRKWLKSKLVQNEENTAFQDSSLLLAGEKEVVKRLMPNEPNPDVAFEKIASALHWKSDPAVLDVVRPILTRLCARYLLIERHRKRCMDPVGNFHLRNGASVYRLNWDAHHSDRRFAESFGIMVNYRYNLKHIDENHDNYMAGVFTTSNQLKRILLGEADHASTTAGANSSGLNERWRYDGQTWVPISD